MLLNTVPSLDLVLLGIGQDGHTASLFPDTDILDEKQKNVCAVYVDKLHAWRISLTYPCINRAKRVMVLVQGPGKADIVHEIFHGEQQHLYPITGVRPQGEIIWSLDRDAWPDH
jgi:6-phosphogluconolactonase